MKYTTQQITEITGGQLIGVEDRVVSEIIIDSRIKPATTNLSTFVALHGNIVDGHQYVQDAYDKGIRVFIIDRQVSLPKDASIILVKDTLSAIQALAKDHRKKFEAPVISITGSNGKTIVKEWLSQLLSYTYEVAKTPKSYNSQVGVPLSIFTIADHHNIAVLEAGISLPNEMSILADIINPDIGIFTNLGDAHDQGFVDAAQKFDEKAKLFNSAKSIIYCKNDEQLHRRMVNRFDTKILNPYEYNHLGDGSVEYIFNERNMVIQLPYNDKASVENILACISILIILGINTSDIEIKIKTLSRINMRLETKSGIWNSTLINDAYNSDLQSIKNAVDHLTQIKVDDPVIILSDLEDNQPAESLYPQVARLLSRLDNYKIITIGKESAALKKLVPNSHINHFTNVDKVLLERSIISNKVVLLKGARKFGLEKLYQKLSAQSHSASLEIDLTAMEHNLSVYASLLYNDTKIMTIIKASAYGSGAEELAKHLEHRQVAYLAVAYVDEGIQLRAKGITAPIIILNPDIEQIRDLQKYNLEPEVYSLSQLEYISRHINGDINIHLKLDTGMHRLGFMQNDLKDLLEVLENNKARITVASIFSHLASSGNIDHKKYTERQIALYDEMYGTIVRAIGYKPLRHIANTAAISLYPNAHYDMVRLGLGLYGIESNHSIANRLERVHTLKAKVMQIKSLKKGSAVGYSRSHILKKDSDIAIINIGYADGLMRLSGNSNHHVFVNERHVPIIGSICMDLTIIDVTDVDLNVGDEVEIFGKNIDIKKLAEASKTIPYEVLARISNRVKKVYVRS